MGTQSGDLHAYAPVDGVRRVTAVHRNLLSPESVAGARRPLEEATTLPREAFTSPAVFERETGRVLRREWLCIGRTDQVPNPGDYVTLDLLGEKLVVTRDKSDQIRVLSRVCPHRGAEVVRGRGNAPSLRCPYHSWTFALDGALLGAPMMDRAKDFDRAACALSSVRCEIWQGWIFVNFDPAADALGPRLETLDEKLAGFRMADMVATEPLVFDSPFNWKILVDNFMEAYHHIAIHRDTLEPLFPAKLSHVPDTDGPYSLLVMPTTEGPAPEIGELPTHGALEPWQEESLLAAVVFPFHLFAPSAATLTWYQLVPASHDRFELRIHPCAPRATLEDPRFAEGLEAYRSLLDVIHRQDIAACEAVWAGLSARSFVPGRLNPLERSIWQFNQWWLERMVDDEASPDVGS